MAIGGGIGFFLGILNGVSRAAEALSDSTLQMLRNVPHLAIIPLVILWFGIGEEAKVFLVAIGVFFPIYLNTFYGIRTVDKGLIEMARVYGLSQSALFYRVTLPGALPSILVGLRYALGIMWLTLIVAETISASAGIGYMTMNAREFLQTDVVLLGVLIYAALGKLADVADPRARTAGALLASVLSTPAKGLRMRSGALTLERPREGRLALQDGDRYPTALPRLHTPVQAAEDAQGIEGVSLALRGVTKSFGGREVLKGIDLDIPAGQFVAVVGRSGGGKTTLMRLVTGLDLPTGGEVAINGAPVRGLQRDVRLLFQDARLLPWQTVLGNIGIARQPRWRETARQLLPMWVWRAVKTTGRPFVRGAAAARRPCPRAGLQARHSPAR